MPMESVMKQRIPSETRVAAGSGRMATGWLLAIWVVLCAPVSALAMETSAKQAIMIDVPTGTILFAQNPDEPVHPASMSKLMTVYMLFERLKQGALSLEDTFRVSENAWTKGGAKSGSSTMFLEPGETVKVEDLIRGIVVQSGNDACIVVAEGLASSEAAFAEQMTRRARELGLSHSTFRNATGWPDPDHLMSVRDLALLAEHVIKDFPEYYHFYSELSFTHNGIKQSNRNPLLYKNMNVDGLKTGHTEASGYGLVASIKRDDRRLILVLNGLDSRKERSQESERLLEWGMREFGNYALFKSGDVVSDADVWLGAESTVPLVTQQDVLISLRRQDRSKMVVKAVFDSPLPAPIQKGQHVADLVITLPEMPDVTVPLTAGADIDQLGVFGRLGAALKFLLFGGAS